MVKGLLVVFMYKYKIWLLCKFEQQEFTRSESFQVYTYTANFDFRLDFVLVLVVPRELVKDGSAASAAHVVGAGQLIFIFLGRAQ